MIFTRHISNQDRLRYEGKMRMRWFRKRQYVNPCCLEYTLHPFSSSRKEAKIQAQIQVQIQATNPITNGDSDSNANTANDIPPGNSFPQLKLGTEADVLSQLVAEWQEESGPLADWLINIEHQNRSDEDLSIKLKEGDILVEKIQKLQGHIWAVARLFTPEELEELLSHISVMLETCTTGLAIVGTVWKASQYAKEAEKKEANANEGVKRAAKEKSLVPATQRVLQRYPSLDSDARTPSESDSE